jgi:hypothetical protein
MVLFKALIQSSYRLINSDFGLECSHSTYLRQLGVPKMLLWWGNDVAEDDRACGEHRNDTAHQCGNCDGEVDHRGRRESDIGKIVMKYNS